MSQPMSALRTRRDRLAVVALSEWRLIFTIDLFRPSGCLFSAKQPRLRDRLRCLRGSARRWDRTSPPSFSYTERGSRRGYLAVVLYFGSSQHSAVISRLWEGNHPCSLKPKSLDQHSFLTSIRNVPNVQISHSKMNGSLLGAEGSASLSGDPIRAPFVSSQWKLRGSKKRRAASCFHISMQSRASALALPSSARDRQFLRTTASRIAVRHDRPQVRDRRNVRRQRLIAFDHGLPFRRGLSHSATQNVAWFSIFFFASAAASSAYLTATEIFPLETRALAIACFYALGTAIGRSTSPLLFGRLIQSGSAWRVSAGYALAAVLLLIAAGTEVVLGIDAEGKSLESIADPLSS
jgi:hypothetical protein